MTRKKSGTIGLVFDLDSRLGGLLAIRLLCREARLVALIPDARGTRDRATLLRELGELATAYGLELPASAAEKLSILWLSTSGPGPLLAETDRRSLQLDELWHTSALTSIDPQARSAIHKHNFELTEQLLELAVEIGVGRFHFLSSAFVAALPGESAESAGGHFNVFDESKARAEASVRRSCAKHGIEFVIYRLPLLVPGKAPRFRQQLPPSSILDLFLEEFQRIVASFPELPTVVKLVGDPAARVNVIRVEDVARQLAAMQTDEAPPENVRTLLAAEGIPSEAVLAAVARQLGLARIELTPALGADRSPVDALFEKKSRAYAALLGCGDLSGDNTTSLPAAGLSDIESKISDLAQGIERSTPAAKARLFASRSVRTSDGVSLATFSAGNPQRPALILVNAFGMPVDFWEPLAAALSDEFFVVTWESRGVPDTSVPFSVDRCAVPNHASDMLAVLDAYGVARATAVAWCSGAQVTLRFNALYPERLSSAVLVAGGYRLPDEFLMSDFTRKMYDFLPDCALGLDYAQVYCDVIFGNQQAASTDVNVDRAALEGTVARIPESVIHMTSGPYRTAEALFRYAHTLMRFLDEPQHAWTDSVHIPALVIGAARDQIANPEASREIARRIPDSEFVMKDEADHFVIYFDEQLPGTIRDFIDRRTEFLTPARASA